MNATPLPNIQQVNIADIVIADDRLRFATESAVESIVASAEELGGIQNPILVRKVRRSKGDSFILMDGGHRLVAAKRMGLKVISAIVRVDITDEDARLIEIDMNVAGATLCPLDEAIFLAERKRIYEKLYPERKQGIAGSQGRWNAIPNFGVASFVKATAEATGVSESKIYSRVAVGLTLSKRDIAELRQAPQVIKAGDIEKLGKIKEPHIRIDVIDRLKHGTAKNVSEALNAISPKKSKHKNPADKDYLKLYALWKRSPIAAKRRLVTDFKDELISLIAEIEGNDE